MTQRESHPIPDKDLDSYKATAENHLKSIKGKYDIEDIFRETSPKETYRTLPDEVRLTFAIRRAVCHYFYFVNLLLDRTGQKKEVQELRAAGGLAISPSVMKKTRFSSSYAFFVMASSIIASCNHYLRNLDQSKLAHLDTPEFDFTAGKGFSNDLTYMFSYYADALFTAKESGIIQEPGDTISITKDFWQAVAKKAIEASRETPEFLALVENTTFHHGPFAVTGLSVEDRKDAKIISWAPIKPEEVIGDQDVTITLIRICDRLALYDPILRRNPFAEFGGLIESTLIDGPPGTGKTRRQLMMMTRLAARAEQVGVPFVAKALTADQVKSEWYGKAAALIKTFLEAVTDPTTLGLVFFDDIDLLIQGDRNSANISGGDLDIMKGLMDFLSGTGTNYVGNYHALAATNKPTGSEDALRQRFVYRALIGGPQSWEEYADLVCLESKRFAKTGLLEISPGKYEPLKRPLPQKIKDVYSPELLKRYGGKKGSFEDIGKLCQELRQKDPNFTGRSVKNAVQVAIARAADFDIPEKWFAESSEFRAKSWDERLALVKNLYQKLTANEILMALEYQFDVENRYRREAKAKRVSDYAEDLEIRNKAIQLVR